MTVCAASSEFEKNEWQWGEKRKSELQPALHTTSQSCVHTQESDLSVEKGAQNQSKEFLSEWSLHTHELPLANRAYLARIPSGARQLTYPKGIRRVGRIPFIVPCDGADRARTRNPRSAALPFEACMRRRPSVTCSWNSCTRFSIRCIASVYMLILNVFRDLLTFRAFWMQASVVCASTLSLCGWLSLSVCLCANWRPLNIERARNKTGEEIFFSFFGFCWFICAAYFHWSLQRCYALLFVSFSSSFVFLFCFFFTLCEFFFFFFFLVVRCVVIHFVWNSFHKKVPKHSIVIVNFILKFFHLI